MPNTNSLTIIFLVLLAGLGFSACQTPHASEPATDFNPLFAMHNINPNSATLIIQRSSGDQSWVHNPDRADQRFIPASTTKIPHSLIALEEGIASPETTFNWDGQARAFDAWNQDQTLTSAYQRSAVWVYQDIIGTVGTETVKHWLGRFDYGDFTDISDAMLTTYWLSGPLQISAREQQAFLQRLVEKDLPLSQETYAQAWPMFKNESVEGYTLYAKTGWMYDPDAMDIGWFVGWVEVDKTSEIFTFALNIDMPNEDDRHARKPIVMTALTEIGAWPGTE